MILRILLFSKGQNLPMGLYALKTIFNSEGTLFLEGTMVLLRTLFKSDEAEKEGAKKNSSSSQAKSIYNGGCLTYLAPK